MDRGAQHEHGGQEPSPAATPAAGSLPTAGHQTGQEEALPAEITPATVLSEPSSLEELLLEWVHTLDWAASQLYLQAHPRLLSKQAEQILEQLRLIQPEGAGLKLLGERQALLHDARIWGISGTYTAYQLAEQAVTIELHEREPLLQQVQEWVAMSSWEESRVYLESHPILRTRSAAALLAQLWRMQKANAARILLARHLHFLQRVIMVGSASAYQELPDPVALNEAGVEALHLYQTRGKAADLERALACWQQALMLVMPEAPDRPIYLSNLAIGFDDRYRHTGAMIDLEAAIYAYQQAVDSTPPDSADYPGRLSNLGTGLSERYSRTGALANLEEATQAYQQAVDSASPDAPDRPALLGNLGTGLNNRYRYSGEQTDLDAAIRAYQQAVDSTPPDSPDRSRRLNNLGNGIRDRYARTGAMIDLEMAIHAFQQAVDFTPPDSSDRPGRLSNLGNGLNERFARTGVMIDLEAAIRAYQQAVDSTSPDSPDRPGRLSNLGNGLNERYRHTGKLTDLEAAIHAYQQAADTTPPDALDRPRWLSNLGNGLSNRYRRTRELTDLEAAIHAYQQAADTIPPDAPDHPAILSNLGTGLSSRYARTGTLDDLDASLKAYQQAVDFTSSDSPERSMYLSNLGTGFSEHYTHTKELTDLEAAIHAYQQAVDSTLPHSPDRPGRLNNLGTGFSERYAHTGELVDLEAAIHAYQQAVDTTPPDAPDRPARLNNLGTGFGERYVLTEEIADLDAALAAWEASWAARYTRFVSLPVLYQLGEQRQVGSLAAKLVIASLEQAEHIPSRRQAARRRAFEVSEGNKSLLLTQLVGHGPLPQPPGLSRQVAARESQLLGELTLLDTQDLANHDRLPGDLIRIQGPERLQQRHLLVQELDELWGSIARLEPGGADYVALRRGDQPTWQDLARLASSLGVTTALLSLFTTDKQVFLFLLRAGWKVPRVVEASLLADWSDLISRFIREVQRYQPGSQRSETWGQPVQPILKEARPHLTGVERLILAPAGDGHLLPWAVLAERAGLRTPTEQPMSLVTLPALGVLPRLRQRPRNANGPPLVIGNPLGDLPAAELEAKHVAERFGTTALLRTEATKAAILSRLGVASLVHLATHAYFDPHDPLDSGIVLADGVMTAREVLEHSMKADLLVLSACQSGQVGSLGGEELAGLSQAFLQAGVRSLLVSLWAVNDPVTAALMQAFYDAREHGTDKAQALRQAMTQIQQDPRWSHPYYWGAFVLMGDWE